MLQRAASNTYSWWWASHIRTKQSKWLEQNLLDMEEKVHHALKLIEEDGDSFAKRAEMYYKKRPELINFVEESYRAYRALAERYDHISTELQNANNTIASVFPEQVQFAMDEEDEEASLRFSKRPAVAPKTSIPKVPKAPNADLKNVITLATKKSNSKKASSSISVAKSGLSKPEALEKIDNLQKRVLTLQTEMEFVRTMYQNEVAKYWEIEKQIKETQEEIFTLQDEFGENVVIEDEEARSLMATAALKSCQETLAELQKKQEQSAEQAKEESEKIRDAKETLESLQSEHNSDQFTHHKELLTKNETPRKKDEPECLDQKLDITEQVKQEMEMLGEKIKDHSESNTSLTVTDMAEKIDELVLKVISLGTSVSSQTALLKRLSTETNELRAQVRTLEEDKATLIEGKIFLMNKQKEVERKFTGVTNQNQSFKNEKTNTGDELLAEAELQEAVGQQNMEFKEMHPAMSEGTLQMTVLNQEESPVDFTEEIKKQENSRNLQDSASIADDASNFSGNQDDCVETETEIENIRDSKCKQTEVQKDQEGEEKKISSSEDPKHKQDDQQTEHEEEPDWQQMFMSGLEGREKVLLSEYTTTLRNYKDVKKKLGDAEQKSQDSQIESLKQLRELKNGMAIKDEEIKSLRQKLILMQKCFYDNKETKELQLSGYEELDATVNKVTQTKEKVNIDEVLVDLPAPTSVIEEKLRTNIDELLEENLDFWLKFSTSFHEIQKFETEIQDLQTEVSKLEEKEKKADGGSTAKYSLKSEARPIYKHLREIQTELTVWLEKSVALKEELQSRFSSLCNIQEEITAALKSSAEDDDFMFTSYQAAKFQGEVLNMKQENNKVAKELKAGIEYVTTLQHDIETTLSKMNEEFRLAASKRQDNPQLRPSESRNRVPLRSFIFGSKPRKQKPSIFSLVAPAMHRKYHGLKAASPL